MESLREEKSQTESFSGKKLFEVPSGAVLLKGFTWVGRAVIYTLKNLS